MSSTDAAYILTIDLGSSGPKVAIVDQRAQIVARSSGSVATKLTPDGGGEQDPDDWWRTTTACVRELMDHAGIARQRIAAVSCASQWSVTVPVDRDGRHLMNAVHWTDSRGAEYTKQVTNGPIKVAGYGVRQLIRWMRLTGGAPHRLGRRRPGAHPVP